MKLFLAFPMFLALAACATNGNDSKVASDSSVSPDMYVCQVEGGLTLSYTTTSLTGQPELSINEAAGDAGISLVNVMGNGISAEDAANGAKQVSVSSYIPDLSTTTWSIAIPALALSGLGDHAAFTTELKRVVSPTSIIGPLPGQHATTTTMKADCQASFVNF